MRRRRKRSTNKRKVALEIKDFKGGSNLLLAEARLKPNESKQANNLIQVEDGLWKTRWGTDYYGVDLGAVCDGAKEYYKSDGTKELVAIASGVAYKSTDGGAWSSISGATFTVGEQCQFIQIASKLYITNGTDDLAYYDGSSLETYTSLNAPANLAASLVAGGLSSGIYTYYGEVTALNDVGETVGSTEANIAVDKPRESWTAATDKIMWDWDAVGDATSYQLYIADQTGREKHLAGTPETYYSDNGSNALNPFVETPLGNTTSGPKFKSMTLSGNRIWGTNDPDNPSYVYWSGTGGDMGKFSEFYGGGWVALEKGGRELPTTVIHYQSGTGTGIITVFCRTPEGRGAIWQISIDTLTVGDTQFSVPTATKVVGSFGTDSIHGVVATNNDILFPNKQGVYSLGPEKNFYGLLRTKELSTKIRPYWRSLIGSKMTGIASYFYDAKVFISVPTTSSGNTKTIVLDLERRNWAVDWSIGAKQFLEYTDSSGDTHFLYVHATDTKLIEISENIQGDLGSKFSTLYSSGRIPLSKLWKDFVKVGKVYIKLGNPRGAIEFEVSGTQKSTPFSSLGSATITPRSSNTGLGWDGLGSVQLGDTAGTPETFADSSDPRYIKIRKKLRDIQLIVTSDSYDAEYTLQGFIIEGNLIRSTAPSDWKLS